MPPPNRVILVYPSFCTFIPREVQTQVSSAIIVIIAAIKSHDVLSVYCFEIYSDCRCARADSAENTYRDVIGPLCPEQQLQYFQFSELSEYLNTCMKWKVEATSYHAKIAPGINSGNELFPGNAFS